MAYCKRRRKEKATASHANPLYDGGEPRPTAETVTTSHANPTYDVCDYKPENQSEDHEYVIPERSKSQSDSAEQWYDDIGNKVLMEGSADDPTYDCVEPTDKGNHTLSFTNPSYLTSSDA